MVNSLKGSGIPYIPFVICEINMLNGKKVAVIMPAYNAEKTLLKTYNEIPKDIVDEIILVDDKSSDKTTTIARELGIKTFVHDANYGYGRNQKTCYREALNSKADVIVMLHPDYQYSPLLLPAIAAMICYGEYDVVLGSRIVGGGALRGGMPIYKYISNRFLTAFQNILFGTKFSEFHTGYRGFSRRVIESLPLDVNSDDFIFDNQMLAQIIYAGYSIGDLSCPTRYFKEASSINFARSVKYGAGVILVSIMYRLQKTGLARFKIFRDIVCDTPTPSL